MTSICSTASTRITVSTSSRDSSTWSSTLGRRSKPSGRPWRSIRPRPVDLMAVPEAGMLIEHLKATATSDGFLIHLRLIFAAITALTVLWVYLAGRTLFPDSYIAPLLGAAFVGLSWEVVSHARFVAGYLADAIRCPATAGARAFFAGREPRCGDRLGSYRGGGWRPRPRRQADRGVPRIAVVFILAFPAGGAAMFDWRGRSCRLLPGQPLFLSRYSW